MTPEISYHRIGPQWHTTLETDKVSVLMPVYNGAMHLELAIHSVLCQSFQNFELVIIDDASTDDTWKILSTFTDDRILFKRNHHNLGISRSLNIAGQLASGTYLARHDQDDISHKHRIRHQVEFLNANPNVVAVGTWIRLRRYYGSTFHDSLPRRQHPVSDANIRLLLMWNNPFVHGSVMMRRIAFEKCGGYLEDINITPPEDYELWTRMSALGEFANIPIPLLTYQINPIGMSQTRSEEIFAKSIFISQNFIKDLLGEKLESSVKTSLTIINGKPHSGLSFHDFVQADCLVIALAKLLAKQRRRVPLRQLIHSIQTIHFVQLGQLIQKCPWLNNVVQKMLAAARRP